VPEGLDHVGRLPGRIVDAGGHAAEAILLDPGAPTRRIVREGLRCPERLLYARDPPRRIEREGIHPHGIARIRPQTNGIAPVAVGGGGRPTDDPRFARELADGIEAGVVASFKSIRGADLQSDGIVGKGDTGIGGIDLGDEPPHVSRDSRKSKLIEQTSFKTATDWKCL
jgi:hypothetical protein